MANTDVILLPGSVMPADLAYRGLTEALPDGVDARAKPLEVYAGDRPPDDYSLDLEVAGLLTFADQAGLDRFELVGYSGGGAIALTAAADAHASARIRSLALLEPAWAGREGLSPEEESVWARFDDIVAAGDPSTFMAEFMRAQIAPDVEPPAPPPSPPPAWMASRPAGIDALLAAFDATGLDLAALSRYDRPVYFAYGGRSNPDYFKRMGDRLSGVFANYTLECFEDRHHFDPPHRAQPERLAAALTAHWARSD